MGQSEIRIEIQRCLVVFDRATNRFLRLGVGELFAFKVFSVSIEVVGRAGS